MPALRSLAGIVRRARFNTLFLLKLGIAMNNEDLFDSVVENALDFLVRAIGEFEAEPKFSMIHFYTAIELFLKARLLQEHWSLVVQKDPDRKRFEAGDFHSVTFDVACDRLRKVVQSPIGEQTLKNFDAVRKHRNKMVHFFHEADAASPDTIKQIASEQLKAWAGLHQLLNSQWATTFNNYVKRFDDVEKSLKKHREYLRAKYDELLPSIKAGQAKGDVYIACDSCHFEAARAEEILGNLNKAACRVCGFNARFFTYTCDQCGNDSPLYEGGTFNCAHCGHKEEEEEIFEKINQFVATSDNYFEALVPANCHECDGYHTVAEYEEQYLCVICLNHADELQVCGWCSEANTGNMEDSSWEGCTVCDGQAGHIADKDD